MLTPSLSLPRALTHPLAHSLTRSLAHSLTLGYHDGADPHRQGMQTPFCGGSAEGLNLNETMMPEHMNSAGYTSHIVGKWYPCSEPSSASLSPTEPGTEPAAPAAYTHTHTTRQSILLSLVLSPFHTHARAHMLWPTGCAVPLVSSACFSVTCTDQPLPFSTLFWGGVLGISGSHRGSTPRRGAGFHPSTASTGAHRTTTGTGRRATSTFTSTSNRSAAASTLTPFLTSVLLALDRCGGARGPRQLL